MNLHVNLNLGPDGGLNIALPPLNRWLVPINSRSNQISDVISDEISQAQPGEVNRGIGDDLPGSKRGLKVARKISLGSLRPISESILYRVI